MYKLKKFTLVFSTILLVIATSLSACAPEEQATPDTNEQTLYQDFKPVASATGKVVPAQWATLSVESPGIVAQLHINENDIVEEGQVLLTLSGGEQLQAAVSAVQIELVNAEQMLEDLYEAANLASTEAQQSVANARDAVRDADRKVNNLINNTPQVDIDQAFANFILAGDKLEKAQEDFEPYANKPEDNLERAVFQSKLAQAQKEYDDAVRYLNNLEGQANEIDLAQAQADLAFAQALLEKAQADYEKVQDGQVDPDLLESAQARLNNAETQLAAAQAALANLSIEAPFSGTISALYIRENEWVNPGQPVLLLGDLTKLQVETTDLNEIDVARIEVGSIATITFDALPQEIIEGTVVRIAPKASQGSGVNYTVIIELEEIPEGLRWDMTAFVDIEVTE